MKCTACRSAEPIIKYNGEVPYWYKGHTTSVRGVDLYTCPRCGNESIPPGRVQEWLEQTAAFRAAIDAQELAKATRPASAKDWIMVEWLDLDPDKLASEMPVVKISRRWLDKEGNAVTKERPYLSWKDVEAYSERVRQAFASYKGSHTTDLPGYVYADDWEEFLYALRKAREIAADPLWEAPRDGVAYRFPA